MRQLYFPLFVCLFSTFYGTSPTPIAPTLPIASANWQEAYVSVRIRADLSMVTTIFCCLFHSLH
ncbi:hypothetical protein GCWU000325_01272 [Alloprevotella tannerae ATCC 51259]|uniref:Uncharacterized protein n=1 Tax=Alloprevotella tannerae ATCC 51259 TaxID=626522 RepID=C9LGD0_9BACT|nr:hypothetical protein GCWU000325_01272 [Alloprevotella tannerae ATCC 51259]